MTRKIDANYIGEIKAEIARLTAEYEAAKSAFDEAKPSDADTLFQQFRHTEDRLKAYRVEVATSACDRLSEISSDSEMKDFIRFVFDVQSEVADTISLDNIVRDPVKGSPSEN